jgi:hypothetical protein
LALAGLGERVGWQWEELDTIDVLGLRAALFRYVKDGDPQSVGSLFVDASQEWFDSFWTLLAV